MSKRINWLEWQVKSCCEGSGCQAHEIRVFSKMETDRTVDKCRARRLVGALLSDSTDSITRANSVSAMLWMIQSDSIAKPSLPVSNRGHPEILTDHSQYCACRHYSTNEPDSSDYVPLSPPNPSRIPWGSKHPRLSFVDGAGTFTFRR
jgi:hypothetical protein